MKSNINTMFYYVSFIPMLVISLAVLCSVMPISTVIQKCFNRRSEPDSFIGTAGGNALMWNEVRSADRNAVFTITPSFPVIRTDAANVSDKITPTIN